MIFAVVKQLKQLQRKPRKKSGFNGIPLKPRQISSGLSRPVEASDLFLGFICNCFSCFTTAKITVTSTGHLMITDSKFLRCRWPRGSFIFLKLGCWLFAILVGMLVGKFIVHKWIFCTKLKLKIFTEDGQGSWMVMFLTSLLSLYIFSFAYNGFLMLEGKYMDKLHASPRMRLRNRTFMKLAAIGTWLGDFLTAWMVTDMMLQVTAFKRL